MGMLFHGKRLSRDRKIINDMVNTAKEPIYIDKYSEKLFEYHSQKYIVSENITNENNTFNYCFIENVHYKDLIYKAENLIIYNWSRKYPADIFLDIDLISTNFFIISTNSMKGNSHELVIRQVWKHA